jgi:hypothetical protein
MFETQANHQYLEIDYQQIPAQGHEQKLSFMMGLIEQCEQLVMTMLDIASCND